MRTIVILAALLATTGPTLSGPALASDAAPTATAPAMPDQRIQLAQTCGFFAILGCFRTPGEASRWNAQIQGGYVVNTSSMQYPNFRAGYYCVVNGPTSYGQAQGIAASWRRVIPDAYVKNSC